MPNKLLLLWQERRFEMKVIEMYEPKDSEYENVCRFASKIYLEELEFNITDFPDIFFTVIDEENDIIGCMGLNKLVRCPLFTRDSRFKQVLEKKSPVEPFGEQSILATNNYGPSTALLIAAMGEYAYYNGISKITFAGIDVSIKIIQYLGFYITEYGLANKDVLLPEEKKNFSKWFDLYKPTLCAVNSKQALSISKKFFERFDGKIKLSEKLMEEINSHRIKS